MLKLQSLLHISAYTKQTRVCLCLGTKLMLRSVPQATNDHTPHRAVLLLSLIGCVDLVNYISEPLGHLLHLGVNIFSHLVAGAGRERGNMYHSRTC